MHRHPPPAQSVDRLSMLEAYLTGLAESHGPSEAVMALCQVAAAALPDSSGQFWQFSLDRDGWRLAARWSGGEAVTIESHETEQKLPSGPTDQFCIELTAQGLTIGALRTDSDDPLSAEQQQLLRILATSASSALANHVLRRRVRQRNVRDPLTGLFNNRYLEDTLERELHRARRVASGLVLIRIEPDQMSEFIRCHGAESADRLLQCMADTLLRAFRSSDVCCRISEYGFGVLLSEAVLADGTVRAEAMRGELSELRIQRRGQTLGPVTVSAGLAAYPEQASTPQELFEAAESAVTRARDEGGDATRVAERLPPPSPCLS